MNISPSVKFDATDFLVRTIKMSTQANRVGQMIADRVVADTAVVSREVVPVDTGLLRTTIHHGRDGKGAFVKASAPYAWRVHEHYGWKHAEGKRAGFIREPLETFATKRLVEICGMEALVEISR